MSTGCAQRNSVGFRAADLVYSIFFEDEEERRANRCREAEDRMAWLAVTGGNWDGVEHSATK
ncbi:MAG: hypothetical protein AAGD11_06995 [Planctomycetota bacterium]